MLKLILAIPRKILKFCTAHMCGKPASTPVYNIYST